ncbi:Ig-like domain-containing protein [Streptomyces sp. Edi2]|uniref:Ig-like domain-containing protein n=1 Tax=Streptomyces sp. Edi2 TaxID=3162528 RepID=UPI003305FAC8
MAGGGRRVRRWRWRHRHHRRAVLGWRWPWRGGGSSAGPAGSTFATGANTENGHVTLTYTTASQPVTTYLKSKPNPSRPGEPVKLTDRVCPSHPASGAPRPTGTVSFTVDGTHVGTAQLRPDGDNCSVAELTVRILGAGTRTLTAAYSGDTNYRSNRGNPETLTHVVRRCGDREHDHDHGGKGNSKWGVHGSKACPPRARM